MKGFKEFLFRGNLVETAVAFIMGLSFAAVVTTFTKIIMDLLGKVGGQPNFDNVTILGGVNVGKFLTALVSFVIVAALLYFAIVKPYTMVRDRMKKEEPDAAETAEDLLGEIRDLLAARDARDVQGARDMLAAREVRDPRDVRDPRNPSTY